MLRVACVAAVAAADYATRYRPSDDVAHAVPTGFVSPLGRDAIGPDVSRRLLLYGHVLGMAPLVLLLAGQWANRREGHGARGRAFAALYAGWLGLAWALQLRAHALGAGPTRIFPPRVAWFLLVADGKITTTAAHALFAKQVKGRSAAFLLLAHAAVVAGVFAALAEVSRLLLRHPARDYLYEVAVEAAPVFVGVLLLELGEARAALRCYMQNQPLWSPDQHRVAASALTAEFVAVPAAFFAHDAHHVWAYPGLPLRARLAAQVAPLLLLAAAAPRGHWRAVAAYERRLWRPPGDDDHEVELAIDDDAPPPAKRTRFGLDLDALGYLRQSLGNLQGTPPPDDDDATGRDEAAEVAALRAHAAAALAPEGLEPPDDEWLRQCRRAFSARGGRQTAVALPRFRRRYGWPARFRDGAAHAAALRLGWNEVLPGKDDAGRRVLVYRVAALDERDPKRVSVEDLQKVTCFLLEAVLAEDPESQRLGVVLVVDLKRVGVGTIAHGGGLDDVVRGVSCVAEAFPVRIPRVFVVNAPLIVMPLVWFMQAALGADTRDKLSVSRGPTSPGLEAGVPRRMRPPDLGGDAPPDGWARAVDALLRDPTNVLARHWVDGGARGDGAAAAPASPGARRRRMRHAGKRIRQKVGFALQHVPQRVRRLSNTRMIPLCGAPIAS